MTEPSIPGSSLPTTATGSVEAPVEDVLEQAADVHPDAAAGSSAASTGAGADPESAVADALEQAAPADDPSPPGVRLGEPRDPEADVTDVVEQEAVVDLDDSEERR